MGGALFALVHLHVLCPITTAHHTCVFFSLVDATNIIGFALDVVFVF
jgi:hypothetical protein